MTVALLTRGDRLAAARQRSLAAAVDWSYSCSPPAAGVPPAPVFPGPSRWRPRGCGRVGPGRQCCPGGLLAARPPRAGARAGLVSMLETLRAYAAGGSQRRERRGAVGALAGYSLALAETAAAGLETSSAESGRARWLEAEDATAAPGAAVGAGAGRQSACGWAPRWGRGGSCGAVQRGDVLLSPLPGAPIEGGHRCTRHPGSGRGGDLRRTPGRLATSLRSGRAWTRSPRRCGRALVGGPVPGQPGRLEAGDDARRMPWRWPGKSGIWRATFAHYLARCGG